MNPLSHQAERRTRDLNLNLPKKNLKRALALAMALALAAIPGLSAAAETVLATRDAEIYQAPSASAPSTAIPAGTIMEKTGEKNNWIRVERAGRTAYMRADAVTEVIDCNEATGYVSKAVPMYKTYGKADKYGTLSVGTELTVYAVAGNWASVGYRGCKGYVRKDALSTQRIETGDAEGSQNAAPEVVITSGKYAYAAVEGAKVYKSYSASSRLLGKLPVNTRLSVGAVCGDWAYVGLNGFKGYMKLSELSDRKVSAPDVADVDPADESGDRPSFSDDVPDSASDGVSSARPARGTAQSMDWWSSDIQTIFARGTTATITDVATGIAWKEMRKGGTNHADCQPLTAADTTAMKAACGKWSWTRRAIFVTIDGVNYAASMNCMPHGSGSITNNNFNGHHCIHFTNSRTHSGNRVCEQHQAAIQKALSAKL